MIQFNKHFIVDTDTGKKARIRYSLDNRHDGRPVVTLYGKTCLERVSDVLPAETENDSEYMTDYVANDRANLFEGHPLYVAARARAVSILNERG